MMTAKCDTEELTVRTQYCLRAQTQAGGELNKAEWQLRHSERTQGEEVQQALPFTN